MKDIKETIQFITINYNGMFQNDIFGIKAVIVLFLMLLIMLVFQIFVAVIVYLKKIICQLLI